jgi:hypothetical protein
MQRGAAGGPPGLDGQGRLPLGQALLPGSGVLSAASPSHDSRYQSPLSSRLAIPQQPFYSSPSPAQAFDVVRANFAHDRQLQEDVVRLVSSCEIQQFLVSANTTVARSFVMAIVCAMLVQTPCKINKCICVSVSCSVRCKTSSPGDIDSSRNCGRRTPSYSSSRTTGCERRATIFTSVARRSWSKVGG